MSGMNNWQSVIVYGTFEELENEDAIKAREFLFSNILTLMTSAVINSFQHDTTNESDDNNRIKDIMFRIKINEVTGRYEK
jgi:nitroimidazol reductase NimA-like FMN-containing flavoprotein (pyridoxamine 5'-phosphate oxidase superfamily)